MNSSAPAHDELLQIIRGLNRLTSPYMVTGSVGGLIYGEPRQTNDVDIVLDLKLSEVDTFCETFAPPQYYCPPAEVLQLEINRTQRGHANLIHETTGFKADLYFPGKEAFQAWGLSRRRSVEYLGTSLFIAPIEYIILYKLRFYREGQSEKHLKDIEGMIRVSGDAVEKNLLVEKAAEIGVSDLLNKVGVS